MLWGLFWFSINLLVLAAIGIIIFIISVVLKDYINNETPKEIAERRKKEPFYKMSDDEVWKLADKGNANAMYEYYLRTTHETTTTAFGWVRGAAELGHPRACWITATTYLDGQFYDWEDHCMFYIDDHPGYNGGKPSREELQLWLECAANHGIKVDKCYWNKLNYYNPS